MSSQVPGRLLASGREADVYALDDRRVLRRYRDGGDVAAEAAGMAYLGERGFPVPEVFHASGTDLVMARVAGPTMLRSLRDGGIGPAAAGALLADLHTRLHALHPPSTPEPGHLPDQPGPPRVLHLDLHADNVILSPRGPMVIDWRNIMEGPPDLDLAVTALIAAEAAVGSYISAELAPAARELLTAFLDRASGDPLSQLDQAVARRAAIPALLPDEKQRLTRAAALVRAP